MHGPRLQKHKGVVHPLHTKRAGNLARHDHHLRHKLLCWRGTIVAALQCHAWGGAVRQFHNDLTLVNIQC